jgi:ADP-ribose pyrophosphatase
MTSNNATEIVFETPWIEIEREYFDDEKSLDGKPFYRLVVPDGVMILAITRDDEIVVVKQFRPALKQMTMELPAGFVEKGEDPRETAIRELYEETGYRCADMRPLGIGRIMMSRCSAVQHSFVGVNAKKDPNFQPQEDIEVVLAIPSALPELFDKGEFQSLSAFGLMALADLKYDIRLMDDRNK